MCSVKDAGNLLLQLVGKKNDDKYILVQNIS